MSAEPTTTAPTKRRYKGADPEERLAERREKILNAGLAFFGTRGFRATTFAMLSVGSGVPHRYLIEIFPEKEDILWEIYQRIYVEVRTAVMAVQAPKPFSLGPWVLANIACACHTLTVDPRKAHITFLEVVGVSSAFEMRRRQMIRDFAKLVGDSLRGASLPLPLSEQDVHYGTIAMVGALNEIMVEWMLTDAAERPAIEVPVHQIYKICMGAFMFMAQGSLPAHPG
jgi:AcrR family transcriptional regulator